MRADVAGPCAPDANEFIYVFGQQGQISVIPLPPALALFGSALAGLGAVRLRRCRRLVEQP